MLWSSSRSSRLLAAPVLFIVLATACGDDDDAGESDTTVVVGIDGSAPSTSESVGGTAEADDEPEDTRDYPSLDEVGRADFTHTIVAGDFLRSIADRYDVEIDDIVGANEWDDGREHLLLPGQEIYLPADAVMPEETTAPTAGDDGAGGGGGVIHSDPSTVCDGGEMGDSYAISEGDTIDDVAERLGLSVDALQLANAFGINGKPAFGDEGNIEVPCERNWPAGVSFSELTDPPVCTDYSIQGQYAFQVGDTVDSVAATFGITPEQLLAEQNALTDFSDLRAGDHIWVCESWF